MVFKYAPEAETNPVVPLAGLRQKPNGRVECVDGINLDGQMTCMWSASV